MFLEHCPTNNQVQIGYTAFHTSKKTHTGTGLLLYMSKLEKAARAQGNDLFEPTLAAAKAEAVPMAAAATAAATPKRAHTTAQRTDVQAMLADQSLTALQKEVLAMHLKAALTAVNFAGAHPTESKSKTHFCPVHGFNDSHGEQDCNRCKSLKK